MTLSAREPDGMAIPPPVDAPKERRPGVPMELDPPRIVGNAREGDIPRQPDPGNILKRKGLAELTPVFGTSAPPRGLSGAMRRAAYRIPEHHTTHWLVLLLADRVDAVEHGGVTRLLPLTLPIVAVGGAAVALGYFAKGRKR
ncbi:MAG TPA: hypothetical protein VHS09_09485 [Polyangiaceae bacterium]|jgi:hypothetical protein|nr:hypothetical protein [Polyangiaceae bacterium]